MSFYGFVWLSHKRKLGRPIAMFPYRDQQSLYVVSGLKEGHTIRRRPKYKASEMSEYAIVALNCWVKPERRPFTTRRRDRDCLTNQRDDGVFGTMITSN